MRSLLVATLVAPVLALCSCEPETAGTEVAEKCVESDLVMQCPTGSNPSFSAQARATCEAAGSLSLIEQDGAVSGKCYGEGSCTVLCQFETPCECGVDTIDAESGIRCTPCTELPGCGNGECEGSETSDNCPIDCGRVCESGRERCQGNDREQCNLQGRWETLACGDGTRCVEEQGATRCE